ncbi:MAG: hypothetical protein JWM59_3089 [Verrucomicrobiales bacterium]|nr:hypothetical protein [Verrucomicrobiales bacterium]
MNRSVSSILFFFAALLLAAGLLSAFYSPERVIGWYPKGITGLSICGAGAVLAAVFGILDKKGVTWALWAGLILSFLFLCQCGLTVFKIVRTLEELSQDPAAKASAVHKLSANFLAFVASVRTFVFLGLIARHRKS